MAWINPTTNSTQFKPNFDIINIKEKEFDYKTKYNPATNTTISDKYYDNSKQFSAASNNNPITFGSTFENTTGFDITNTKEKESDYKVKYNSTLNSKAAPQFLYANATGIVDISTRPLQINAALYNKTTAPASNIDAKTAGLFLAGYTTTLAEGQTSQVLGAVLEKSIGAPVYNTFSVLQYKDTVLGTLGLPIPGAKYMDFRSARILNNPSSIRLDGARASYRDGSFNVRAAAYAAASAAPIGPYSIFNLDGYGKTGYGWGDHDNRFANRRDFTLTSLVRTEWDNKDRKFYQTKNILDRATPFRGDKVNVIDFGQRTLDNAYQWRPRPASETKVRKQDLTQDFIKFMLTGPKLYNRSTETDDIIIFRAIITNLTDRFSPNWVPSKILGRADENHLYQGYSRDLDLQFTIYATDRDELKPIWRKLNALAGYTAPTYDINTITMIGPWMRITIGDLFRQQPVIIQSLSYTLHDQDTTWEINLENDKSMMQTPHKVDVSMDFKIITDALPQTNGQFYTLAKQFDDVAQPTPADDNWLSDFKYGAVNTNDGTAGTGGSTKANE